MSSRTYYRGSSNNNNNLIGYAKITVNYWNSDTLAKWLDDIDFDELVERYDEGFDSINKEPTYYFNIREDWKINLLDNLADFIDIKMAEKIIYEMGIRHVMRIVKQHDYWGDNMPDLTEDTGIRQVIYCLLDYIIEINDGYVEINEDEYP